MDILRWLQGSKLYLKSAADGRAVDLNAIFLIIVGDVVILVSVHIYSFILSNITFYVYRFMQSHKIGAFSIVSFSIYVYYSMHIFIFLN